MAPCTAEVLTTPGAPTLEVYLRPGIRPPGWKPWRLKQRFLATFYDPEIHELNAIERSKTMTPYEKHVARVRWICNKQYPLHLLLKCRYYFDKALVSNITML